MSRFLMVVPYKARDLEGHALVARHLERTFGHEVSFTNGYGVEHKLRSTPADVLVLDHLAWNFKVGEARLAKSLGMRVAVLPTEGLLANHAAVRDLAGAKHDAFDVFDRYLCWGTFHRDALAEVVADPLVTPVVGCPRFDFYRRPLLDVLPTRAELGERLGFPNPNAPLVVWATNTPYAHRSEHEVFARYVSKANWERDVIEAVYRDQRAQFEAHSRVLLSLARRRADVNLVIKVHPAEWPEPYARLVADLPNAVLAYDAPIRDFIAACDLLVHRGCTTATEAWIMRKRVVELHAGQYRRESIGDVTRGCEIARDLDELERCLTDAIAHPGAPRELEAARADFLDRFYAGAPGDSALRVAAELDALVADWTPAHAERVDRLRADAMDQFWATTGRRAAFRVKRLLGVPLETSLNPSTRLKRRLRARRERHVAEPPITRSMVEEVWVQLEGALEPKRAVSAKGNEDP